MLVKSLRRKFLGKERTLTLEDSLRAVGRLMKRIVSNAGAVQLNVVLDASV